MAMGTCVTQLVAAKCVCWAASKVWLLRGSPSWLPCLYRPQNARSVTNNPRPFPPPTHLDQLVRTGPEDLRLSPWKNNDNSLPCLFVPALCRNASAASRLPASSIRQNGLRDRRTMHTRRLISKFHPRVPARICFQLLQPGPFAAHKSQQELAAIIPKS